MIESAQPGLAQALNSKKTPAGEPARLLSNNRVELLRQRINDEGYLYAAIQRMALVMSNELMEISLKGGLNEQRKKRK